MAQYYAQIGGKVIGPFDAPKLIEMAKSNIIAPDTPISLDTAEWHPAAKFGKLFSPEFVREYQLKKSVASLTQRRAKLNNECAEALKTLGLANEAVNLAKEIASAKTALESLRSQIHEANVQLGVLQSDVAVQELGIYKRHFAFDATESFKAGIKKCTAAQKESAKLAAKVSTDDKAAVVSLKDWIVGDSAAKGREMILEQIKLMLRAFNGECDASIAKIKHSNFPATEKRIRKAFETINKLGSTKEVQITNWYLDLKLTELRLSHELELFKEDERTKQREIKEQMREEARAEKEIADAKKKAEREETKKHDELEAARKLLADEHGKHNEKLAEQIAKLEAELSEAIDRKAKAIARAQLTKSGHVYVLSNIGTMGTDRYKIGMTRRLEPLERVKELGDASVPFPFDVHAMIYSEDAPKLENELHKLFESRRVNLVNTRKEYFDVSLDDIRVAVKKLHGEITFVLDHDAEQYRESLAIKQEAQEAA